MTFPTCSECRRHVEEYRAAVLEREEMRKERDALAAFVAEVRSMTAQFVGWTECDTDLIEGQEQEVTLDHNRMLGRLRELHRRAEEADGG